MKLALLVVPALCLLTLPGCVGSAIRSQTNQGNCENYGFQRGTPAFADCMLRLEESALARSPIQSIISPAPVRNNVYCTHTRLGANMVSSNCQ